MSLYPFFFKRKIIIIFWVVCVYLCVVIICLDFCFLFVVCFDYFVFHECDLFLIQTTMCTAILLLLSMYGSFVHSVWYSCNALSWVSVMGNKDLDLGGFCLIFSVLFLSLVMLSHPLIIISMLYVNCEFQVFCVKKKKKN